MLLILEEGGVGAEGGGTTDRLVATGTTIGNVEKKRHVELDVGGR